MSQHQLVSTIWTRLYLQVSMLSRQNCRYQHTGIADVSDATSSIHDRIITEMREFHQTNGRWSREIKNPRKEEYLKRELKLMRQIRRQKLIERGVREIRAICVHAQTTRLEVLGTQSGNIKHTACCGSPEDTSFSARHFWSKQALAPRCAHRFQLPNPTRVGVIVGRFSAHDQHLNGRPL